MQQAPEWLALVDRRREIEQDETLSPSTREALMADWRAMAEEARPRMQPDAQAVVPVVAGRDLVSLLVGPRAGWVGALLLPLALGMVWAMGGVHDGAWVWKLPRGVSSQVEPTATVPTVDAAVAASAGHPGDGVNLNERIASLQQRLEKNPEDFSGWVLLARTLAAMQRFPEAAQSLRKALVLSPGHPDVLADLSDMVAMGQNKSLKGEPESLARQALQSDPSHEKALALLASAAEQQGRNDEAQSLWQRLSAAQAQRLAKKAEGAQGGGASTSTASTTAPANPGQATNGASSAASSAASGAAISTATADAKSTQAAQFAVRAELNIAPSALKNLTDQSALFVVLKTQQGPGMPLAALRLGREALAAGKRTVELNQSHFLQPQDLGNLPNTLYIQARLAVAGTAQANPGDVLSAWQTVTPQNPQAALSLP